MKLTTTRDIFKGKISFEPFYLLFCFYPGQVKKNGDKNSNDDSESKEADSTASAEPLPNGATATGGSGTLSRGSLNSHQAIKRTASTDSSTKPPPGKKKKI